jgi:hypothetical protein
MSFQSAFPRAFSLASIRAHAPSACGVYGISNGLEWILIGATDDIQADLLKHAVVNGSARVQAHRPTGFVYEVCDPSRRESRRDALVKKYTPVYSSALSSDRTSRSGDYR